MWPNMEKMDFVLNKQTNQRKTFGDKKQTYQYGDFSCMRCKCMLICLITSVVLKMCVCVFFVVNVDVF